MATEPYPDGDGGTVECCIQCAHEDVGGPGDKLFRTGPFKDDPYYLRDEWYVDLGISADLI